MLRDWGLGEALGGDPIPDSAVGFYIDGEAMPIDVDDAEESLYCPQQVLVRNLTDVFLRDGGDLRYEAKDVSLHGINDERPLVSYRDGDGTERAVECDFIAGCDGFHGVSRSSIPASALTEYSHTYGYNWLSVLAAVPTNPSGMAIHSRGLAYLIPAARTPPASTFSAPSTTPPSSGPTSASGANWKPGSGPPSRPARSPTSGSCRCAAWSTTR